MKNIRPTSKWYSSGCLVCRESLSNRTHFTEKLTKDTQKVFQKILEDTHQQFIQHVEEKRAGKLQVKSHRWSEPKVPEAEKKDKLYDGDIHIAREAKKLGYRISCCK
jgi:ClpP class serine protease